MRLPLYRIIERGTRGWPHQLRHPTLAVSRVIAAQPRPILVYQMSKVGSQSVCAALEATGIRPLHVHFLGPLWKECRDQYRRTAARPPLHLSIERVLRPYLRFSSHRLKVVTLVRDPIARHVSSAFQTHQRDGYQIENVAVMLQRLRSEILSGCGIDYCAEWFDRELKAVFGVNVLDDEFDRTRGSSIVIGPRADVLILKLEYLDQNWTTIADFVGRPVTAARTNQRANMRGAESYREVQQRLNLPREAVRRYYDHPWVRHFYTREEVADFCGRWSTANSQTIEF